MAGSLIKIDEEIVTSAVASVTLTGIDSTYDVYMLQVVNAEIDSATQQSLALRVTVSGTADSTANYDQANKNMRSSTSFVNESGTNSTSFQFSNQISTTSQTQTNAILYLFNFNNSSEYSFGTNETTDFRFNSELFGRAGGFVHTVAQACDGVNIFCVSSANIDSGTFTLYGLKK
tara:strand:+ start:680 stop:1204 length:525 start_codon:yes stop_codon:yes gene_type:complete